MSKKQNYQNYYKKPMTEVKVDEEKEEIKDVRTAEAVEESTEQPKEEIKEVLQPKKAKVTGAKLVNMRAVASKDGKIIDKLPEGTIVEIGESKLLANSGWTHIKYNDKTGFMMSQFLKEI